MVPIEEGSSHMADVKPRFINGSIGPTANNTTWAGVRLEQLIPSDIVSVYAGLAIRDYTVDGVEEAMTKYWDLVDSLVQRGAQRITLGAYPIGSQLGRPRVLKIMEETEKKTGLPADSTMETVVALFRHLGAKRIAIGSRWAPQLNRALVDYFEHAGIAVAAITSEGQWAHEAFGMSVERGVVLAMKLGREAMRQAPDADALLLPGGTWLSLAAVPPLEDEFDVPVVGGGVPNAWRYMQMGLAPPIADWGRILANPNGSNVV
jgi:maleate cis-trans isomerase